MAIGLCTMRAAAVTRTASDTVAADIVTSAVGLASRRRVPGAAGGLVSGPTVVVIHVQVQPSRGRRRRRLPARESAARRTGLSRTGLSRTGLSRTGLSRPLRDVTAGRRRRRPAADDPAATAAAAGGGAAAVAGPSRIPTSLHDDGFQQRNYPHRPDGARGVAG
jgi:hypothetical protein